MGGRIANFSKGPLPKAPEKRKVARRLHDRPYLAFLHTLPCCISGTTNDVIAHHITIGRGRMGVKEDDSLALPLSAQWHNDFPQSLHAVGEKNFWRRWGVDPFALASDLYGLFQQRGQAKREAFVLIAGHRALAQRRIEIGLKLFSEDQCNDR